MISHRKEMIGAFFVAMLMGMLCLRLAYDAVQLWNAQNELLDGQWVMVGPGNMTSEFMLHVTTQSRNWIGSSSLLLVACFIFIRRLRPQNSNATRMEMIALWIIAPTVLTDLLTLRGQQMSESWFTMAGGATIAPLIFWLCWKTWSRRERDINGVIPRAVATIVVVGTLLIGTNWLRTGVEIRGKWADTSMPVPSPRLLTPTTSEDCTRETMLATLERWGRSGDITGFDWVVVAADGQVFSSPGSMVPPECRH